MKTILSFGASTSSTSINVKHARWASSRLQGCTINFVDLNDFEMPIYSVDREDAEGIPPQAKRFKQLIKEADGILISFAEHNGSFTAAFKNIFDWTSRVERGMWEERPMFLLATSPGKRGARAVLEHAVRDFPHRGGRVVSHFSLPSFGENFDEASGIKNPYLLQAFNKALSAFEDIL